jgi:hypothetical protein
MSGLTVIPVETGSPLELVRRHAQRARAVAAIAGVRLIAGAGRVRSESANVADDQHHGRLRPAFNIAEAG